jgi:undecaprenyl-diphosphatase
MAAAAGYKLLKLVLDPTAATMLTDNLVTLLIGNVVAFIVAMGAIKFFIGFLTKYGFKAFGYYRIVVGGLIIVLLLLGRDLSIV